MNTNAIQTDVITEDMICDRCMKKPQQQPHTCPFAVEIHDDDESLCTCCEECEDHCRMDI